jgi:hypothetical protein
MVPTFNIKIAWLGWEMDIEYLFIYLFINLKVYFIKKY